MSETRWIWLEAADGMNVWRALDDVESIVRHPSDYLYGVKMRTGDIYSKIRAFSVHPHPSEWTKKE